MKRIRLRWQGWRKQAEESANWLRNPLMHPAIARMGEREKADLPFDPARFRAE